MDHGVVPGAPVLLLLRHRLTRGGGTAAGGRDSLAGNGCVDGLALGLTQDHSRHDATGIQKEIGDRAARLEFRVAESAINGRAFK